MKIGLFLSPKEKKCLRQLLNGTSYTTRDMREQGIFKYMMRMKMLKADNDNNAYSKKYVNITMTQEERALLSKLIEKEDELDYSEAVVTYGEESISRCWQARLIAFDRSDIPFEA